MRIIHPAFFTVGLAVVLAACGSSAGPGAPLGDPVSPVQSTQASFEGYLGTGAGFVEFLSLHAQADGSLTGDMLIDTSTSTGNASPAWQLSSQDYPASMTTNGSSVTLDLGGLLGTTLSGTLDGGTLTLEIPNTSTGTIQTGTLQQASSDDFNAAVVALNTSIASANAQADQQQQAQATASANAAAESNAQSDLATLQGAATFTSDLSTLAGDVQTVSNDVGTVKSDAAQGVGDSCVNLTGSVDVDVTGSVDVDISGSFGVDLNTLTTDIGNARSDIATMNNDLSSLSASGLPAPSGASGAITAARQAISQAVSQANGYITQVNGLDAQAYQIANGLATGACAGDGPGSPPSPVGHVS